MAYVQGSTLSGDWETTIRGWREPKVSFCSLKWESVSGHQPESCCQLCLCTVEVSVFSRSPLLPSCQSHVCSAAATAGTATAPSSLAGGSM